MGGTKMSREYDKQCCMCSKGSTLVCAICPASDSGNKSNSPCSYVKSYIDHRGWKYSVKSGIGGDNFKACYQRPDKQGNDGWHGVRNLPRREYFDEAQADLNQLAEKKGWREYGGLD